jgi:hypothetical protein
VRFLLILLAFAATAPLGGGAAAQTIWPEASEAVSYDDFRVFAAAINGLQESAHPLRDHLEGYELVLIEEEDFFLVYFTNPNRPPGTRGSSPNMQEFEVQLRKHDLSFIKWIGWR